MCPSDISSDIPKETIDYSRLKRRQAERAAGVSRATLYRYRDEGKLTVTKDQHGQTVFDAAELQRVFPDTFNLKRLDIHVSEETMGQADTVKQEARNTPVSDILMVEKRYLTEERDRLREETDRLRRELVEERRGREEERAEFMGLIRQHQETVKQLTDQRQVAVPPQRGVFGLFRRG